MVTDSIFAKAKDSFFDDSLFIYQKFSKSNVKWWSKYIYGWDQFSALSKKFPKFCIWMWIQNNSEPNWPIHWTDPDLVKIAVLRGCKSMPCDFQQCYLKPGVKMDFSTHGDYSRFDVTFLCNWLGCILKGKYYTDLVLFFPFFTEYTDTY